MKIDIWKTEFMRGNKRKMDKFERLKSVWKETRLSIFIISFETTDTSIHLVRFNVIVIKSLSVR